MTMARAAAMAWLAAALVAAVSIAQAETLPKPGLVVEWRQNADFGGPVTVRQEIVSASGTVVAFRETTIGGAGKPNEYETWRGLVLIKRHTPASPAFTESTMTFTVALPALEKLLPLAPARKVSVEVQGRTASRLGLSPTAPFMTSDIAGQLDVTIERRETIVVPAGRFETMVIRHEVTLEQVGMDNRTTVAARIWFAPALGWPVKKHQLDEKGAVAAQAVVLRIVHPR